MAGDPDVAPYLEALQALPFVRRARPTRAVLEIKAPAGTFRLHPVPVRSHLSRELTEHLCATHTEADVILARAVGRDMGDRMEAAGLNFIDLAGNCHIKLGDRYVARIQGRRPPAAPTTQKAMRAAAYKALFAVLAKPAIVDTTVRQLAEAAGVSRQAAIDIRKRLVDLEVLMEVKSGFRWRPQHAHVAMEMFLTGYATTLRPQLLLGRFRSAHGDPGATEEALVKLMPKGPEWRWGGGAGADRLTHYYHGPNSVLHVTGAPADLARRLRLVRDAEGPVHLLDFPGPLGLQGATAETAHPLLIHAELLVEGGDRAREAAAQLFEQYLPEDRFG